MTEDHVVSSSDTAIRPPPVVIHAPPPTRFDSEIRPWAVLRGVALATGFVLLLIVVAFPLAEVRVVLRPVLLAVAGILAAAFGFDVLVITWAAAEVRFPQLVRFRERPVVAAWRGRYEQEHPGWAADKDLVALGNEWRFRSAPPDALAVAKALGASLHPRRSAAHIVCYGPANVPQLGELRFEPTIITPARSLWTQMVPAAGVVALLWMFVKLLPAARVRRLPGPIGLDTLGAAGVSLALVWVWRACLRPKYVRLAPGMVQVLEFRFRDSKPTIRSYPMLPGTIVVIFQTPFGGIPRTVQFARGGQTDCVPVWQMSRPGEAMQQIWQALLSTAPTPPLSEEELVG